MKDKIPCTSTVPLAPKDSRSPSAMPLFTLSLIEVPDKDISLLATVMSAKTLPFLNAVTFTPVIPELDVSVLFWSIDNTSDSISAAKPL